MHTQTLYVFPVLEHRQIYFSSSVLEEPKYAAYRFFKMHHFQFNSLDQSSNFFEANSHLHFSAENPMTEPLREARHYIFNREKGLIAKFYERAHHQWNTFYQGPWYRFVNQFGNIGDLLYPCRLSVRDLEYFYLTLTEIELLIESFRAKTSDPKRWQGDADFLERQYADFLKKEPR